MSDWKRCYSSKLATAEGAVAKVRNGARIYLGSMCAEPRLLIKALKESRLDDVELIQLKGGGEASRLAAHGLWRFRHKTFYVEGRRQTASGLGHADQVPLLHSEIPRFFRSRRIAIDVAMIQVSEPDRFGQVSLGISVDVTRAALESARTVIAQVNPRMPRTLGDTFVPVDRIDYLVEGEEDLLEIEEIALTDLDRKISRYTSELIDNGSIVQMGFAGISQGLTEHLKDHRDLGVHSEMFTDALIDLIEAGIVTNSTKRMYKGKSLAAFCMGTRRLYDYVDDNPLFEFHPSDVVLNPAFIASNDKMVACNIAMQVDLRGQIRQGSLGWTAFEGSGGEQDFMRGAGMSQGGRSIVCLRSTDLNGNSNIVTHFGEKAAIIMNRGDVHFVVTEFGAAYLGGKSIRERAMALIEVAHPDHREALMSEATEAGYIYPNQHYYRMLSPGLRERIRSHHTFKGDLKARVRAIKSTDESMIRDLFYHLSQSSVYFRYFSPKRSMPHDNLYEYVTLAEDKGISLVVTIGARETRRIIAEARYVIDQSGSFAEAAFMVAEEFQGRGIGSFLLNYLIELARERGVEGFRLEVLSTNGPMLRMMDNLPFRLAKQLDNGVIVISFRFDEPAV
jgi:acyl-CoA hydrolase